MFERRLAEDETVLAVCGRLTGDVVLIVLDLGLVIGIRHLGLGLRRVGDTGEIVLIVLDRRLEGDADDKVSGTGVDKVGGSRDTVLMVFDRGLEEKEAGENPKDANFLSSKGLFWDGGNGC